MKVVKVDRASQLRKEHRSNFSGSTLTATESRCKVPLHAGVQQDHHKLTKQVQLAGSLAGQGHR